MSSINLSLIQDKLPELYAKYENKSETEKSVLCVILGVLANALDHSSSLTDRVDAAIGIDTTYDEDLEYRWGSLLGINKIATESYDLYRNRLKLAMPSMIGGTKDAIKYAIATVVGVENNNTIQDDYIEVVDGWEYNGSVEIPDEYRQYGCFVCTVDLSVGEGALDIEQKMIDSINAVKASGTTFHVLYKAFTIGRYYEMDVFSYDTLSNTTYDSFGVEKKKK